MSGLLDKADFCTNCGAPPKTWCGHIHLDGEEKLTLAGWCPACEGIVKCARDALAWRTYLLARARPDCPGCWGNYFRARAPTTRVMVDTESVISLEEDKRYLRARTLQSLLQATEQELRYGMPEVGRLPGPSGAVSHLDYSFFETFVKWV